MSVRLIRYWIRGRPCRRDKFLKEGLKDGVLNKETRGAEANLSLVDET